MSPARSRKRQLPRGTANSRQNNSSASGKNHFNSGTQGAKQPVVTVQLRRDGSDSILVSDPELESVQIEHSPDIECISFISSAGSSVIAALRGRSARGNRRSRGRRGSGRTPRFQLRTSSNVDEIVLSDSDVDNDMDLEVSLSSPRASASSASATEVETLTSSPNLMLDGSDASSEDGGSSSSSYSLPAKSRNSAKRGKNTTRRGRGRGGRKKSELQRQVSPLASTSHGDQEQVKDNDSWSDSSTEQIKQQKKKSVNEVKPNDKDGVKECTAPKIKVKTDWSDDENLADQPILPEAAIFTNSVKACCEQLREFRRKQWTAEESTEKDLGKSKGPMIQSESSDDLDNVGDDKKASKLKTQKKSCSEDNPGDAAEIKLSASAKKRIEMKMKRLEQCQKKFLEFPPLRETTTSSSSEDELQCLSDDESSSEVIVKVRCHSDIVQIPLKNNEQFVKVFHEIAKKCDTKPTDVMLLLRDKTVTLEDTPKALKLMAGDILDCCIWNTQSEAGNTSLRKNYIRVKVQSNDCKKKSSFSIHKLEPLSVVMEKYAAERNILLEKMVFKFDGEKIDLNASPVDLDMEDESCIDVKII